MSAVLDCYFRDEGSFGELSQDVPELDRRELLLRVTQAIVDCGTLDEQ
jgi:hypothetical protein